MNQKYQFFESVSNYKLAKQPGEYQFFISDGNKLKIFNKEEQSEVIQDIKEKFKGFDKIVHSSYILSNLEHPWQRKMLLQQYEISNQIKAKSYVFHLRESKQLYNQLEQLIKQQKLIFQDKKCQFAIELTSRTVKNPKEYLQQIEKYRQSGMIAVFDIAHIASSGLFKDSQQDKIHSSVFNSKNPRYDKEHDNTLKQIIKFTNKNASNFDILHLADQAIQVDMSKDIHTIPFKDGHLFSFNNIFTSIDLLDSLLNKFQVYILEFIDKDRLFRRAVERYLKNELYIDKELISYYVLILRWHVQFVFDDYSTFQISSYEALAQQLIEISRQPIKTQITMNSPLWKKYCFSHKISQLLLIVELNSYFFSNKIILPWNKKISPSIERFDPLYDVITRKSADSYIKKLIKSKIIKSTKSVFGSYLRGNNLIGDLDILLDIKDKQRIQKIVDLQQSQQQNSIQSQYHKESLFSQQLYDQFETNNNQQDYKEYSIVKLQLNRELDIQIYFTKLPNPVMELFLTGNKNFNIYMRKKAKSLGYKLTNTQLLKQIGYEQYKQIKVKSQSDIFKYLEMKVVPPIFRIFLNDTKGYYNLVSRGKPLSPHLREKR